LTIRGHFAAIGEPVVLGREFTADDERSTQPLGDINQTFAHIYFGKTDPLGKRVWYDHDHPQSFVIVGVVADAKHNSLREPAFPQFYLPFLTPKGDEPSVCSFEVRYSGNPTAVTSAIRAAVREVAPGVPPVEILTMNELMGETLITERAISRLSSIFGLLAMALAAIGLYSVMSYNVTGRINEIGIRMSLGALPGEILKLVLREILILVGFGVGLGLPSENRCRSTLRDIRTRPDSDLRRHIRACGRRGSGGLGARKMGVSGRPGACAALRRIVRRKR
jgi:hypothetical protein